MDFAVVSQFEMNQKPTSLCTNHQSDRSAGYFRTHKQRFSWDDAEFVERDDELTGGFQYLTRLRIALIHRDLYTGGRRHYDGLGDVGSLIKIPFCGTQDRKKILFIPIPIAVTHYRLNSHLLTCKWAESIYQRVLTVFRKMSLRLHLLGFRSPCSSLSGSLLRCSQFFANLRRFGVMLCLSGFLSFFPFFDCCALGVSNQFVPAMTILKSGDLSQNQQRQNDNAGDFKNIVQTGGCLNGIPSGQETHEFCSLFIAWVASLLLVMKIMRFSSRKIKK